jgi:hypothetical protein
MKTIAVLAFLFLALLPAIARAAPAADESAAIDHLIAFVRDSKLVFIRNGSEYDSAAAAEHIASKYAQVKDKITTAEDFIDNVASRSSYSGKPYMIRWPDNSLAPAADWLHKELKKYREGLKH